MDNGEKKGGSTPTLDTIRKAPGLETLWQLHFSDEGGAEHNTAEEYIANLSGGTDAGNYLKLTASPREASPSSTRVRTRQRPTRQSEQLLAR